MTPKDECQFDAAGKPLPVIQCQTCNYKMDAATLIDGDERPSPGDYTLCFKCGEIYVFDDAMGIREPTLTELNETPKDVLDALTRAQKMIRRTRPLSKKL